MQQTWKFIQVFKKGEQDHMFMDNYLKTEAVVGDDNFKGIKTAVAQMGLGRARG